MVFYGTNASNIKTGKIRNISCPHCETNTEMNYSVFGRYFHLYWIPFFPIGRVNIIECNSCKSTYDLKDVNETIRNKFHQELDRNPVNTPIKLFSGLILAVLIGLGIFGYGLNEDNNSADYAKNPKVGDVYFYEIPEMKGHFTTLKLTKITKDTIYCLGNNMEIDLKSDIDKILEDKNYTYPDKYGRKELLDLNKDLSVFYKIERK